MFAEIRPCLGLEIVGRVRFVHVIPGNCGSGDGHKAQPGGPHRWAPLAEARPAAKPQQSLSSAGGRRDSPTLECERNKE